MKGLVSLFRAITFGWGNIFPGGSSGDVEDMGRPPSEEDEEESDMGEFSGEEDVDQSEFIEEEIE